MQFNSVILLAFSAAAVSAAGWEIPRGQLDGVYLVNANDDGSINHTLISAPTPYDQSAIVHSARSPKTQQLSSIERDLTFPQQTTCLDYTLVANDNNVAYNGLSNMCNRGPSLTSLGAYSVSGDAVVYWCNYPAQTCSDCSTLGEACSPADLGISLRNYLSPTCGGFKAGWVRWVRQAYGQESISRNRGFCGNGLYQG